MLPGNQSDQPARRMAWVFHSSHLVWLITALLTGIFVALPIGYIVYNSFTLGGKLSFEPFVRYFASDSSVIRAAANSFILATAVAVVSVLVGVPLAFGVSRTDMAWKGLVRATVIVAIITPPFLRTMAYILLFGPNAGSVNVFLRQYFFPDLLTGPLNIYSLSGLILLCSPGGIAQVFILTSTALAQMDPSLEEVARITGANRWRTIWQVTLKVTRNAILAGALMAFTVSLALYGTPHLLGIDVLTTEIRQALMMPVNFKKAAVLSNFSIIVSVIALILYRRAIRNGAQFQTVTGKGFRPAMMAMGKARHLFTILGVVYGVVSFVLPYGALLIMSFTKVVGRPLSAGNVTLEHYKYVFTSPFVLASIKNSASTRSLHGDDLYVDDDCPGIYRGADADPRQGVARLHQHLASRHLRHRHRGGADPRLHVAALSRTATVRDHLDYLARLHRGTCRCRSATSSLHLCRSVVNSKRPPA